ncbi:phosphoglycerate transporter protein PgtP [Floricoccus penangensis]|uniref:phosphoglycerate transporter protein PgtP n=1 Tax=Floricoccus penangensis TaxID=1859475 RepID=UPI00203C37DD|nr:phosphoglycerate transporter protein PgtP [Floricoccus penangensis]URZ87078.1 phosphoglycerate transporter protein PgtP [Floricoccus penangensis]
MSFLKPPKAKTLVSAEKVDPTYKKLRLQVFIGIFIGYAGYYLVRNNFSIAIPKLIEQGFTKAQLGWAFSAVSIAYGFSKFFMAILSDRSNARIFLPLGLVLTAIVNLIFGFVPAATESVTAMFVLLFLVGWFGGMGWPPCGRVLTHWYSISERGMWTSVWNTAHNVGGAIMAPLAAAGITFIGVHFTGMKDYTGAFIFPALAALVVALISYLLIRDTPESQGLPAIEEYKDDFANSDHVTYEEEFTVKEILFTYVLKNKWIWIISFANIFVYFVRYGIGNWSPTYLFEVKNLPLTATSHSYALYELAGIPGTIFAGWFSDKVFKGRRGPAGFCLMLLVGVFVFMYWKAPSMTFVNIGLFMTGFLIYGPVMLIGLQALDSVPKKAAGTAAGLTGLFGYLFGSVAANAAMGVIVDNMGWDAGFTAIIASCLIAAALFSLTWNLRGQEVIKK